MALAHDSQGFLIGDPVDISRSANELARIHRDVADIKRYLFAKPSSRRETEHQKAPPSNTAAPANRQSATPQRDSAGRFKPAAKEAATPKRRQESQVQAAVQSAIAKAATPKRKDDPATRRDNAGRFTASGDAQERQRQGGMARDVAQRVAAAVAGSAEGLGDADPTVKAFQEVAEPIKRGYDALFGGGDKDERWYKRIFKELRLFRKEESVFNKAANRSLRNLEDKPVGGGDDDGGGILSMLGGLLGGRLLGGRLLGGGLLGGIGKALMGFGKGGLGKGLTGLFKGGLGKGLLRKIPYLGAILGGLGLASDVSDTEGDSSLSRREKDRRNGAATGGLAGTLGGMFAGAAAGSLLGPVGTVVGGVVGAFLGDQAGQIIGDKMGGWVNDIRNADIPGKVTAAWEDTTGAIKSGWETAVAKFTETWDALKENASKALDWLDETVDDANNYLKKTTGVDVKGAVKSAYDKAVDFASRNVIEKGANAVEAAKNKAVELGGKAVDAAKEGGQWALENTTPGKMAAKAFDYAGSLKGSVSDLIHMGESKRRGYNDYNRGSGRNSPSNKENLDLENMTVGELMQKQALPVGDKDRIFAAGKYEVIPETMKAAVSSLGISADEKFSPELQERIFTEYLATKKKGRGAIERFIKEGKGSAVSAADSAAHEWASLESPTLGRGVYDGQGTNAAHIKSSVMVQAFEGARQKYVDAIATGMSEKDAYAQALGVMPKGAAPPPAISPGPRVSATVTASAKPPTVPTMPKPQPIAEAPPVMTPLSSQPMERNIIVQSPIFDVGQDVTDRSIAHLVTGGMSSHG